MEKDFFSEAQNLDEEWEFEDAIKVCKQGIDNHDHRCAYLLGIIFLEHVDPARLDEAVEAFKKGVAYNDDCKYELARIYSGVEYSGYEDYETSLEYYFETNKYLDNEIGTIKSMLDDVCKDKKLGKIDNSINFVVKCSDWVKMTQNKNVINKLNECMRIHLEFLYENAIRKSNTIDELEYNFTYFNNFIGKKIPLDTWIKFEKKRFDLFMSQKPTVKELEDFELKYRFTQKEELINSILFDKYLYLARYYLEIELTSHKAIEYYELLIKLPRNVGYASNISWLGVSQYELICELNQAYFKTAKYLAEAVGDFDAAREEIKQISDLKLRKEIANIVDKEEFDVVLFDANNAPNKEWKTHSIKKLIGLYNDGIGTNRNIEQAINWSIKLYNLDKSQESFDFVFDVCNNTSYIKNILIDAKNIGLKFNITQQEKYEEVLKRKLFIFDFDGTIFDTDFLRYKRKAPLVPYNELLKVGYIRGFESVFLNNKSKLYLKNNDVIIITSSRKQCCNTILDNHPELKGLLTYNTIYTSTKKKDLKIFLNQLDNDYDDIFAFGDDEKDANIYSELELKFYIVPNTLGYQNDDKIIDVIEKSTNNFRNNYLYDLKRIDTYQMNSIFMDDIVVYYKNYNCTKVVKFDGKESGSDYCPPRGTLEPLNIFNNFEFGKKSKNITLEKYRDYFVNTFNDLQYNNDIIIAKVPGHDEVTLDLNRPMTKIVKSLSNKHKECIDGSDLILRCKVSIESKTKGNNRSIKDQLDTLVINPKSSFLIGKTVYLFDDIFTSGSTLMACAELLYRSGAGHVVCLCIARTCGYGKYAPVEIM